MTQVLHVDALAPLRPGGAPRRACLIGLAVVSWVAACMALGAGIAPGSDLPVQLTARAGLVVLGLVLVAAPVLLLLRPARKLVRRRLDATLQVAATHPAPPLPAFETWAGPERMFKRLVVGSLTYVALPLVLLVGWSLASALFLRANEAAVAFAVLTVVPLFFLWVTLSLPDRLRSGVRAGAEAGQVVALRIDRRLDRKQAVGDACQSWFDAVLPDGQHLLLRTPRHFGWASPARGVLESPDLVLVMGLGAHQGLLLVPGRPADAVWLLGPVPLTRAPRPVIRAFAEGRADVT